MLIVPNEAEFPALIRDAKERLKLSDRRLAELLRVSRPTVERWKTGKNIPSPALRGIIMACLNAQSASPTR